MANRGQWELLAAEPVDTTGDLPAPQILLDKAASRPGDTVMVKCKVPAFSPSTRVIFCRDGKDLAVQPIQEGKFAYDLRYDMRANSSASFACLYQHKGDRNHETNSLLSSSQFLHVTDSTADPEHDTKPEDSTADPEHDTKPEGLAIPLWVWILRSTLLLFLLASAPLITCVLEKVAAVRPESATPGGHHGKRMCQRYVWPDIVRALSAIDRTMNKQIHAQCEEKAQNSVKGDS
ncbi:hypothetical protein UY3_14241 [Chelonia mydas]|uniref:Ig-like domain-containing protein n=1 Tax=Chelonia mydas TaxID=8469 RepID=M7ATG4_CHEMY|nr:hypothetical protein UY3_14241 [Chelonia mydas]